MIAFLNVKRHTNNVLKDAAAKLHSNGSVTVKIEAEGNAYGLYRGLKCLDRSPAVGGLPVRFSALKLTVKARCMRITLGNGRYEMIVPCRFVTGLAAEPGRVASERHAEDRG